MSRIILEPANPFDFEDGDLEKLADELRNVAGKATVVARRPEHGYGVSFNEVLHVWIVWNQLGGPAASAVVIAVTKLAVSRWKRDRARHPDKTRPRSVTIWGPNGKPLKSITVDAEEGDEPEVRDNPVDDIPVRPRPQV